MAACPERPGSPRECRAPGSGLPSSSALVMDIYSRTRDAATRLRRAAYHLRTYAELEPVAPHAYLASVAAFDLLVSIAESTEILVGLLDPLRLAGNHDDQLEDLERDVKGLAQMLRGGRIGAKLAEVEGRTPEERELFLSRSAELRDRRG